MSTPQDHRPPPPPGAPTPPEEDQVIPGHTYDGIKEYDNPMPGWWVWSFVASVVFGVAYWVGITFFDVVDTYEDDLAQGQAALVELREAHAAAHPTFTPDAETLARYLGDAAVEDAGGATFATYCAVCHGDQGQGLIGPNLADAYWLHGNTPEAVFMVVTQGVPAQGMTPWESVLTPEQRAEVTAYVLALQGTAPPNPKAPQGDLME